MVNPFFMDLLFSKIPEDKKRDAARRYSRYKADPEYNVASYSWFACRKTFPAAPYLASHP
ncbi:MAG: hypothetical protein J7L38_06565 [Thermoproteales archaeon]|nr:hypothetical protein [Thermoproteales archaeon]